MVGLGTIVLSEEGLKVFGRGLLDVTLPDQRGSAGMVVAYSPEGVWFQDERLRGTGRWFS